VVGRGELTDKAWARIAPLLPVETGRRGGRWRSHRQVINAILWKERTGAPWRDLPERYGPWKTAHERLRKWTADGTWDRILENVIVKDDSLGTLEDNVAFVVSVDSTSVRAHQHAAGARKKGAARTGSRNSPLRGNASDGRGEG
jgi:transposase